MSGYIGIKSIARKITNMYVGVNGIARSVQKAYIGDASGKAQLWYTRGPQLGGLAIGSSMYFKVDNVRTEWLVVQQGNPDASIYDSSCDGTWLLMKNIYATQPWSSSSNDYENSSMAKTYLPTFFNLIDDNVRQKIKQVKIPYWNGKGSSGGNTALSLGLTTKIFLLSDGEVGWSSSVNSNLPEVGAKLTYFGNAASRIALLSNGSANSWWTRSPSRANTGSVVSVSGTGTVLTSQYSAYRGVRPCIILPKNTLLDDNMNIT